MSISLCIITKNNQNTIKKCIDSVRSIVDEMVVADTGSTDKTIEIAESLGAKVYSFEWNNSFSDAKNFCISHATKEYILALDADETIAEKDLERLKFLEKEKDFLGFSFIQRNYKNCIGFFSSVSCTNDEYEESKVASCFIPRRIVRFFKNTPKIRFQGVVHDSVEPSINKIGKILETTIPIHHFGMLSRDSERTKMYIEMEKMNLKGDYFQDYQIAIQLHSIGNIPEALQFLEKSINRNPNFHLSWLELGIILIKLNKIKEAEKVLKRAESLGTHEMIFSHLGIVYGILQNFNLSISYFEKSLSINPKNPDVYFNLALTYIQSEDKEKAKDNLKKALYLNPMYREKVESLLSKL